MQLPQTNLIFIARRLGLWGDMRFKIIVGQMNFSIIGNVKSSW